MKQLIPLSELPNAARWFRKNPGGWREYMKTRGLNVYIPIASKKLQEGEK